MPIKHWTATDDITGEEIPRVQYSFPLATKAEADSLFETLKRNFGGGFESMIAPAEKYWLAVYQGLNAKNPNVDPKMPARDRLLKGWARTVVPEIAALRRAIGRDDTLNALVAQAFQLALRIEEARWRFGFGDNLSLGRRTRARNRESSRRGVAVRKEARARDTKILAAFKAGRPGLTPTQLADAFIRKLGEARTRATREKYRVAFCRLKTSPAQ